MSQRKRYAIVGTGGRCRMYIDAILRDYTEFAELVGFCDVSQTRMDHWNRHIAETHSAPPRPTYSADRFDEMIREQKPDVVIVTTMDCFHHEYIVRAMDLGCDAITEKPMTIDDEKARAIFDAIDRTGRSLRVTFNYRFQPGVTKMKELIMQGAIGTPTLVELQWLLDTSHGADYFRRWHREKDKSGGLLLHKASHHFDIVNWLIDSFPKQVYAMGDLRFYGRENAEQRGEKYAYDRYTGTPEAENDPFALRLDNEKRPNLRALYLDAEKDSGYVRDRNVFGDNITIEDTMAVMARYRSGAILSYSLLAYCPWEGERISVNGTRGRIEYFSRGKGHVIAGQSDSELAAEQYQGEKYLRMQQMFKPAIDVEIPSAAGGHGGGDKKILERIFRPDPPPDPFHRDATHIDGAAAVLLGAAANHSMATGKMIDVDELLELPRRPAHQPRAAAAALA